MHAVLIERRRPLWLWRFCFIVAILSVSPVNTFQYDCWAKKGASLALWSQVNVQDTLVPKLSDHAPSWESLRHQVLGTSTGSKLQREALDRKRGLGPPHTDAPLRLFPEQNQGLTDSDVRVTLYRDQAAWCPYCQKVWLFLELKRIPYKCQKLPLNAYGDKPDWYTRKVNGGKLPAVELDGTLHVESLEIMDLLERTFPDHGPAMIPSKHDAATHQDLLQLERELQRAWFSLTFYPVQDRALAMANPTFLDTVAQVDRALGDTDGAWFLGGDQPSLVDLQYIVQVERIIPSVLYWKGLRIRDTTQFHNLDRWLAAWESTPAYLATRSDYYTHVMVLPSQNGPGYMTPQAKPMAFQICGLLGGSWHLPLNPSDSVESFPEWMAFGTDYHPAHEAAFQLCHNHVPIVRFAGRGAGQPGRPSFHAELADPYAEIREDFLPAVDVSLRHVTHALLRGALHASVVEAAEKDLGKRGGNKELRENWEAHPDDTMESLIYYWNSETGDSTWTPPTQQLDTCLTYLRDRIGVPRDMGSAAAMQLRAHLNWAIDLMNG